MRNWNLEKLPKTYEKGRFQTTYEELKLFWPSPALAASRSGFQTTYEELKLITNWETISKFCFQTTYEELKPASCFRSGPWFRFQTTYEELKQFPFDPYCPRCSLPDYLWGIETGECISGFLSRLASRLPMRNWNHDWQKKIITELASRLPMRNWNSDMVIAPRNIRASRLPMRNWNFEIGGANRTSWLPDYLWGIETLKLTGNWWFRMALPDYLWGIETWSGFAHSLSFASGFQTTYEELKPTLTLWMFSIFSRFQTTYEELKPGGKLQARPTRIACFQTTYEELKPREEFASYPFAKLPDYLWGIETRLPQSCCIQLFRFQTTYEELKLWTTSGTFPAFSFQTTYEELKLVIFRTSATQLWLPDYLWGIETRIWWTVWRHRCASRLPMRNWNTVH